MHDLEGECFRLLVVGVSINLIQQLSVSLRLATVVAVDWVSGSVDICLDMQIRCSLIYPYL